MDFIRNMSPRLAFLVYAAAAVTMAFFWLVVPEFSISFGYSARWFNGWSLTRMLFALDQYGLALLMLGNFILPGVALLLSWTKKELDWLWTSIAFGYFFTTGVIFVCNSGMGLTAVWYMIFLLGAAWGAFAFMRRGLPASLR